MIVFQKAQMALNEAAVAFEVAHREKHRLIDRIEDEEDLLTREDVKWDSVCTRNEDARADLILKACNFARECWRVSGGGSGR